MIEVAEVERGGGLWRVVMGDGEGRGEGGEGVVYWGLLLCGGRGRGSSVVMARKSWGKEGGRRRVVWWWGGGRWPRLGKGWRLPLARHRLGDFDLRFFLADVLEMGWVV